MRTTPIPPSMTRTTRATLRRVATAVAALLVSAAALAQSPTTPRVAVDADGTVHMPAQTVPVSDFLSAEAKAYVAEHLVNVQKPEMLVQENGVPPLLAGYLQRQRELFAVDRKDTTIGGVHAYVYTPRGGVAAENRNRVLIDLHGGGFSNCWPGCTELESLPIAALGRIEVVGLDYRQGPKFRHPAASEDVAAAYRELLKTYRPANIGIYGCSAGGMLAGMSIAWFQRHGLPRPGAVGMDYFAGTDPNDPLVAPASSPAVLAKFPPTLIVTATRGFELSNAVYTHAQLVKNGVDANLHVWDGMFHGFFYNPDVPESRDCFDVIVRFFDEHLGK
jgi:acetyl esterase/lipase